MSTAAEKSARLAVYLSFRKLVSPKYDEHSFPVDLDAKPENC